MARAVAPCVSRGESSRVRAGLSLSRAGRGLNPRPESSTPVEYPPAIPNPERHLLRNKSLIFVFCLLFLCFRVDGSFRSCAGRGLNPRPESSTPVEYPPAISNPERHLLRNKSLIFVFCLLFLCFRVDGSFRSGVQPPTGSKTESSISVEYPPAILNPERHLLRNESLIFVFYPLFLCFRVGGSFQSGVQPPTGSRPAQGPTQDRILYFIPNRRGNMI